jgi:hypothetical protein
VSEALDAMVKAMLDELGRQMEADDRDEPKHLSVNWIAHEIPSPDGVLEDVTGGVSFVDIRGRFDLEKVARAGLAAISTPDDAQRVAGSRALREDGDERGLIPKALDAEVAYRAMIRAILKEEG